MKKAILILLVIIPVLANGQYNVYDDLDVYGRITGKKDAVIDDSVTTPIINADTAKVNALVLDGRLITQLDTSVYSNEANVFDVEQIFDDTVITASYKRNIKYIVNTDADTQLIVISLPNAALVNKVSDVKELQFILKGSGGFELSPIGTQTINNQSVLINTAEDKAVSVIPTSDSTWAVSQDSRGDVEGQLRIYPLDSLSGINSYYYATIYPDSVGDVETTVFNGLINGDNVELVSFITDSNFFTSTNIQGGRALIRLRAKITSGVSDVANLFVTIYRRSINGDLLRINDSTNRASVSYNVDYQYVLYETNLIDYEYNQTDRFLFVVSADEVSSNPTLELSFEGNYPTYYARDVDLSVIKTVVGAAGVNRSVQTNINGVLSGDANFLSYDDSLSITKSVSVKDSLGLNGYYIQHFYQKNTRSNTEAITASESVQTINFEDLGSSDYTLITTAVDAVGNQIFPTISNKTSSSFDVQINVDCTLYYNAILNQ